MKLKLYPSLILLFISIACLQAQDYLISFAGSGAVTTVTTVKVENLTQGTSLTMNGTDVLHLKETITEIETVSSEAINKIVIYPNPTTDYAKMEFNLPESGETVITLYDISGRKVVQKQDLLANGQHTYKINGLEAGIYFVRINSGRYSFGGKLLCSGSQSSNARITYENSSAVKEKPTDTKGATAETMMQYNVGDRLKLTGISDIYCTVITDVPTENKTITFNFIACTDGEGNNYPIIRIGTTKGTENNLVPSEGKSEQIWMAENLKTTKYRNGIPIGTTTPYNKEISGEIAPAYQWAYEGNESNVATYGRLYTWYAVMDSRNICPTGWHIPNNDDWTNLATFLGGLNVAGGKLKEAGTTHWSSPNAYATNETGFTALPGGLRSHNGAYMFVGTKGFWWSSTEYSSTNALNRDMDSGSAGFFWNYNLKPYGFSVRCLKD